MRRFVRENGLSLFFFGIFALSLVGMSFAGRNAYNAVQAEHGGLAGLVVVVRHLAPTSAAR